MGDLDRAFKTLVGQFSAEACELFAPNLSDVRMGARLERLVDKEIEFATRISDRVFRAQIRNPCGTDQAILIHLEPAVRVRLDTVHGLLCNAVLLHQTYGVPVITILVAIDEVEFQLDEQHASYSWQVGGTERLRFNIDIVKLWEYDGREALASNNPVGWILAPLMRGEARELAQRAVERVRELADQEKQTRENLVAALSVVGYHRLGDEMYRVIGKGNVMEMLEAPGFREVAQELYARWFEIEKGKYEAKLREAEARLEAEVKRLEAEARAEAARREAEVRAEAARREAEVRAEAARRETEAQRLEAEVRADVARLEAEAQQREAEAQQREAEAQQREAEAQQREAEVRADVARREAEAQQREAEVRAEAARREGEAQQREAEVRAEAARREGEAKFHHESELQQVLQWFHDQIIFRLTQIFYEIDDQVEAIIRRQTSKDRLAQWLYLALQSSDADQAQKVLTLIRNRAH